jgi:hypothetical protein
MKKPTYVFTNRAYPPVGGATGELLKELAEGLVSGGARVIVVTVSDRHPSRGLPTGGVRSVISDCIRS